MGRKVEYGINDLYTWCNNNDYGKRLMNEYTGDLKDFKTIGFGSGKKLTWKCLDCSGIWEATPSHRTSGRGCPYCRGHNNKIKEDRLLKNMFPELVEEWNDDIDINNIASFSNKKVNWKCSICGYKWEARVINRTKHKSGCPKCAQGNSGSLMEYMLYYICKYNFNDTEYQFKIDNMSFDIGIPTLKVVIEYQGRYYHKENNKYNVIERDKYKRNFVLNHGVRFITVNEMYGGEYIYRINDDIYFNADNMALNREYCIKIIIDELNSILNTNMQMVKSLESICISEIKYKDVLDSLGKLYPSLISEWNTEKKWCSDTI